MKNIDLKLILLFSVILCIQYVGISQDFGSLDNSPHDISYYRVNKITPPVIKVLYGRPQKNDRELFGNLVPYGKIWRVGANEATEIRFYQDVLFGGIDVKAGTYVLYAIPELEKWILILNSNLDVWGIKDYNKDQDVARAEAKVSKAEFLEALSIGFKEKGKRVNMVIGWDTTRVTVPIKIK